MKNKKIMGFSILLLSILFVVAGCGNKQETAKTDKLQVVTTFYPMYDFTKNVVGDNSHCSVV